ncbi:hypothetical protein GCM10011445_02230 [Pseudocitrobacter faecalis]|nr:hypothetical protein GCM10011445_02230 [Pseudocitrobacter faecalis]
MFNAIASGGVFNPPHPGPLPQGEGENPHRPLHLAQSVPSPEEEGKTRTDLYIMLDRPPHLRKREKTRTELYIVLDRFPHLRERGKPAPIFTSCSIGPSPQGEG